MTDQEKSLVGLEEIRSYLVRHGWAFAPSGKSAFDVFSLGHGKSRIEVLLPHVGASKSPARWVNAALRTASQLLGQSELQFAASLRALNFDAVKTKIGNELVRNDTISLNVATEFVRGVRALLEAAATTELRPRPHFPRVVKAAKSYSDDCRFGHTYKGSFGFVVESPIRDVESSTLPGISPIPPFERRVIERLVRGISLIPIAKATSGKTLMLESFGGGLSANMCEEIAKLVRVSHGLEFSFELSSVLIPSVASKTLRPVVLEDNDADFLQEVAVAMREERAVRYSEIVGQVVALRTRGIPGDLDDLESVRQVAISGDFPGLGGAEVRVNLSPEDYLFALRAHEDGFSISLAGNLELIGRSWFLLDARLQQDNLLFEPSERVLKGGNAADPRKSRRR